ncbi:MAG TPA: HAMP domain-containing sensor histidine kinase [Herpetosiphonaceae bacterium]|nr:HAMP domain-containing sensor histidine kinase [Herpetosiphonaceae bacterium]
MEAQHSPTDAAASLTAWCTFVEGAPPAMAVTIGAGHELHCLSPALAHLLEAAPVDLRQRAFVEVVPSSTTGVVAGLLDRVFSSGVAEVAPDVEHAHPLHSTVYWTYTVWPLSLDDGPPIGLALDVRDTTNEAATRRGDDQAGVELREVNERLLVAGLREQEARAAAEAALAVRDQFLSIASHELKTPLTSLLGYTHMLQQEVLAGWGAGGRVQRMVGTIDRQARRLSTLIGQLLDVSRIEQGQFSIEQQPLDLAGLVTQVVDDVRLSLKEHTITLTHPDARVMVLGDALRLEQVLQNLLGNAVKYSPAGGPVLVRVEQMASEAILEVEDRGIGIPAEARARLFEPFSRAGHGPAYASGFGIGLYVVEQIVKHHGGRITVESTEGQGSVFRVSLPVHLAAG